MLAACFIWPVPGLPVIQLHVQKQQSHKTSAPGMSEMLEPAPVGWFLLAHKHPAVWILMHHQSLAAERPMAAYNGIEAHTRGAHRSRVGRGVAMHDTLEPLARCFIRSITNRG